MFDALLQKQVSDALDYYRFIFHYVNEVDPVLLSKAITAYSNTQKVTAESDGQGGEE
tara:strand:+ start:233 stop:403 length:171 start_codon:yes stop_codon:yes gene_type:complete